MSTWFPPLPGDQPNEEIVPIGQTEDETPEPLMSEEERRAEDWSE